MRTLFKLAVTAAMLAAGAFAATPASAADPLKVGFIYVGPIGDHGWSYQHDQGRLAIEKEFGDKVETVYVEKVAEGPDAERAITRLARQGAGLIFTTSFGFMEQTLAVAKKFPEIKFEHATGYKQADNVATYSARFYEGRYVIGQIAARMSKSGVAGYVASFPIPEVVRGINAFLLGAQSINPDFKLMVVWVNSWFDPGKEADAAKVLIGQGADIITQHTDSTAPLQIAEEQGVTGFGQASDMIKFAPKAQLTAIIDDWSAYYIERTKAVLDGTWTSGDVWGGMGAEMVVMADYTNMPDDVKAMAEETEAKITSGEFHPFTGPIYKQDGTLAVEEGKVLDDGTLLGMNWYVQGIDDSLPQ
ncbi:BMP family ABC transporter substrate-binding protein [Thalassobaculum litoreum]|uniref:Simple sugar transport system substrate-binding protein n=1 Tax=Thalassobaculum litoreum DSM 18839 TaxID=1123362 RepID=A0A8G2BFQ4_9PROT|nr:BMP family ABC transporter substrate-binding protein [Thalassobaculum litoreum]SDF05173.1 simple sugar transport system substrate-binding protein [Thalassobaculum litoreum DSM 18839]